MACLSVASSPSSTLPFTLLGFVPLLGYSYTRLSQLVPYYCPPCRLSCCAHNTAVCFAWPLCLSAGNLLPPFGWPRPPSLLLAAPLAVAPWAMLGHGIALPPCPDCGSLVSV